MSDAMPRTGNAKFIVLEGIDGSGSTTQGEKLTNLFRSQGRPVVFTREPTQGPVGLLIRLALTGRLNGYVENGLRRGDAPDDEVFKSATDLDPHALALLFAADRMDHIATEVAPNLAKGRTVVCDRYLLSTLAYQGLSIDREWLRKINERAPKPDLTIFLDVDAERARQRIVGTRWTEDIFESVKTQKSVREVYHDLIDSHSPEFGPVIVVDASPKFDAVQADLRRIIGHFMDTGELPVDEHQHDIGLFSGSL
jgi:dTMP kinase